jgi:hypothetical protein
MESIESFYIFFGNVPVTEREITSMNDCICFSYYIIVVIDKSSVMLFNIFKGTSAIDKNVSVSIKLVFIGCKKIITADELISFF